MAQIFVEYLIKNSVMELLRVGKRLEDVLKGFKMDSKRFYARRSLFAVRVLRTGTLTLVRTRLLLERQRYPSRDGDVRAGF